MLTSQINNLIISSVVIFNGCWINLSNGFHRWTSIGKPRSRTFIGKPRSWSRTFIRKPRSRTRTLIGKPRSRSGTFIQRPRSRSITFKWKTGWNIYLSACISFFFYFLAVPIKRRNAFECKGRLGGIQIRFNCNWTKFTSIISKRLKTLNFKRQASMSTH